MGRNNFFAMAQAALRLEFPRVMRLFCVSTKYFMSLKLFHIIAGCLQGVNPSVFPSTCLLGAHDELTSMTGEI